jgi:sugar phosphate isomerase/epimerase
VATYRLGINTCFAVKRWPEPAAWAELVRQRLGLTLVQHSLDLVEPTSPAARLEVEAAAVRGACGEFGVEVHSTFTGLAAYSSNLLLHPHAESRALAEEWYGRMVDFTAAVGARATGGHIGAFSALDSANDARWTELSRQLGDSLERLTRRARRAGLSAFLIENLAPAREPSTFAGVEGLLAPGDGKHVPVRLCLDVGHMCTPGLAGLETDPYSWLSRFGRSTEVVHLQQSDSSGDHHWPFTEETNRIGRIEADRVLSALDASGADQVVLILEVIPAFEAADDQVLRDLEASVHYWQAALARHSGRLR